MGVLSTIPAAVTIPPASPYMIPARCGGEPNCAVSPQFPDVFLARRRVASARKPWILGFLALRVGREAKSVTKNEALDRNLILFGSKSTFHPIVGTLFDAKAHQAGWSIKVLPQNHRGRRGGAAEAKWGLRRWSERGCRDTHAVRFGFRLSTRKRRRSTKPQVTNFYFDKRGPTAANDEPKPQEDVRMRAFRRRAALCRNGELADEKDDGPARSSRGGKKPPHDH